VRAMTANRGTAVGRCCLQPARVAGYQRAPDLGLEHLNQEANQIDEQADEQHENRSQKDRAAEEADPGRDA